MFSITRCTITTFNTNATKKKEIANYVHVCRLLSNVSQIMAFFFWPSSTLKLNVFSSSENETGWQWRNMAGDRRNFPIAFENCHTDGENSFQFEWHLKFRRPFNSNARVYEAVNMPPPEEHFLPKSEQAVGTKPSRL